MNSRSEVIGKTLFVALVATGALAACDKYDPPPEVDIVQPPGGAYITGDPVFLTFSEPIDADTLRVRVWPSDRNIENLISEDADPLVDICEVSDGTCGDLTLELTNNRQRLALTFAGDLGEPGNPLILEVLSGLADPDGNDTGVSVFWDFQFRPASGGTGEPVVADNGLYIVVSQIEQPIPAILTLISDVVITEEGQFALAGAEGDEIGDEPPNTRDPTKLMTDRSNLGFTIYVVGTVSVQDDGGRLLETSLFDVTVPIGGLRVILEEVQIFAVIEEGEDGNDIWDGTLTFGEAFLQNGETITPLGGATTALYAGYVPPDLQPQPEGYPQVCGDLCGVVDDEGFCEPPADFPPEGVCPE